MHNVAYTRCNSSATRRRYHQHTPAGLGAYDGLLDVRGTECEVRVTGDSVFVDVGEDKGEGGEVRRCKMVPAASATGSKDVKDWTWRDPLAAVAANGNGSCRVPVRSSDALTQYSIDKGRARRQDRHVLWASDQGAQGSTVTALVLLAVVGS